METILSKYLVINKHNMFWNIDGVYITVYPSKITDSLCIYFENIEGKIPENKIPICFLSPGRYGFELKTGCSLIETYFIHLNNITKSNDKLLFINIIENVIIYTLIRWINDKNINGNTKIYLDALSSNSDIKSISNIIDILDD